jgi:hypothetical protein
MKYTPTDALKLLTGVTRKRLYEAMKNGELSYATKNKGRLIDASELARVFSDSFIIQETQETLGNISKVFQETKRNTQETHERQKLIDTLNKQTLLLSDQRTPEAPQPATQQEPVKRKKFLGMF